MNYKVYRHTNIENGKVYIGMTGKEDVNDRWRNGYGYFSYDGRNYPSHMQSAIKKYGWDNFESEVVYDGLSYQEATEKEVELIAKHNSINRLFGYNKHVGGFGGTPLTKETKAKLSEAMTGSKNGMYGIVGKEHPMYGRKHSKKTRLKMSEARKGREPWNKGLTGIYSQESRNKISETHRGNQYNLGKKHTDETKEKIGKSTKKQWESKEFRELVSNANIGNKNNGKAVICGEKRFDTIKECAEHLGYHWKTVSRWINGKQSMPKKYTHLNIRYENAEVNK